MPYVHDNRASSHHTIVASQGSLPRASGCQRREQFLADLTVAKMKSPHLRATLASSSVRGIFSNFCSFVLISSWLRCLRAKSTGTEPHKLSHRKHRRSFVCTFARTLKHYNTTGICPLGCPKLRFATQSSTLTAQSRTTYKVDVRGKSCFNKKRQISGRTAVFPNMKTVPALPPTHHKTAINRVVELPRTHTISTM